MGNVAASGGYFIAMAADKIVAQPTTITGSIGIVAGKFVVKELLDELKVTFDGVRAGRNAGFFTPTEDFTPEQWALFQSLLDEAYADFTGKAAKGRGLSAEEIEAVAGGRVWSGADAMKVGLVDALGGLDTAVTLARQEAGIPAEEPVALIPFPAETDPFESFIEEAFGAPLGRLTRMESLLARWLFVAESLDRNPQSRLLEDPRLRQLPE
jgi:protease-4